VQTGKELLIEARHPIGSNAVVGAIGDAGRMIFERRLTESTCRSNRSDLVKGAVGNRPKAAVHACHSIFMVARLSSCN
jgi:hypothetical protein